jgi:hypothetical protein
LLVYSRAEEDRNGEDSLLGMPNSPTLGWIEQGSLKETNNTKRSHETHFNDEIKETTTSGLYLQTPKCLWW